jgi:hypothetical protein
MCICYWAECYAHNKIVDLRGMTRRSIRTNQLRRESKKIVVNYTSPILDSKKYVEVVVKARCIEIWITFLSSTNFVLLNRVA